eukprot:TRINITY_DN4903_c0_g1_i1.p1 TRINITY_DN4903_c0_g1~~TRINITY_DN4903_c0_g1_i1.p1  ORF type:complete len:126 (+),score=7.93 TRINITY_DN4903_c0_g1_i1:103-480(+)
MTGKYESLDGETPPETQCATAEDVRVSPVVARAWARSAATPEHTTCATLSSPLLGLPCPCEHARPAAPLKAPETKAHSAPDPLRFYPATGLDCGGASEQLEVPGQLPVPVPEMTNQKIRARREKN